MLQSNITVLILMQGEYVTIKYNCPDIDARGICHNQI